MSRWSARPATGSTSTVWPDGDGDVDEVAWLVADRLPAWIDTARGGNRDLLLIRDGGR